MDEDTRVFYKKCTQMNHDMHKLEAFVGLQGKITSKVNRHTWATLAKIAGVPKDVITEALGHASKSITDVYLDKHADAVLDEANARVMAMVIPA